MGFEIHSLKRRGAVMFIFRQAVYAVAALVLLLLLVSLYRGIAPAAAHECPIMQIHK
jgi:IS4 transposase